MRLNESQKRAIYSDIMNDVARVIKSRINEGEYDNFSIQQDGSAKKWNNGTTFCFEVRVDKTPTINKNKKSCSIISPITYLICTGTSDTDTNQMCLATCVYAAKMISKNNSNVNITIKKNKDCSYDLNKMYRDIKSNNERYLSIAKKIYNSAIDNMSIDDSYKSLFDYILSKFTSY